VSRDENYRCLRAFAGGNQYDAPTPGLSIQNGAHSIDCRFPMTIEVTGSARPLALQYGRRDAEKLIFQSNFNALSELIVRGAKVVVIRVIELWRG
jgi:hypothetical protein